MQPVEAIVFRNVIIFPVQISSLPFPSPGWPTAKSKLIYSVIEAVMINENLVCWNGLKWFPINWIFPRSLRCKQSFRQTFHHMKNIENGLKWQISSRARDLNDSMVAIRRVKRLMQFSILAVLLATLLLFLQWNEISDSEKFNIAKRGMED